MKTSSTVHHDKTPDEPILATEPGSWTLINGELIRTPDDISDESVATPPVEPAGSLLVVHSSTSEFTVPPALD